MSTKDNAGNQVDDEQEPVVIHPDSSDDSDDEFVDAVDEDKEQVLDELSDVIKGQKDGRRNQVIFDEKEDPCEDEEDEKTGEAAEASADDDALKARQEAEGRLSEEELSDRKRESMELKAEANQKYVASQLEEAISIYTQALEVCPLRFKEDRAILYANRAAAKRKMGDNELALEDCNESLSHNPVYLKALLRRAQLFEELDKPHESIKDYQEVLKLDQGNIEARVAVASRLPEKIKEKDEKLKAEMMDNLKKLGNMVLNPFGLSTDNFNLVQDPNTGGYSVNFSK